MSFFITSFIIIMIILYSILKCEFSENLYIKNIASTCDVKKAPTRFERVIEVLQTFALPLGYGAILNCLNHKMFLVVWMTPTGIEPVLPPWKGDVLTAWPRSLTAFLLFFKRNSPSWTRTNDNSVNSRVLYRLSYWGLLLIRYVCLTILAYAH